jgi:hypothetical protein
LPGGERSTVDPAVCAGNAGPGSDGGSSRVVVEVGDGFAAGRVIALLEGAEP